MWYTPPMRNGVSDDNVMKRLYLLTGGVALIIALGALGCSSTEKAMHLEPDASSLENERDRSPRSTDIEPQDICRMVERMVESLLSDPAVLDFSKGECPILDIMPIKNKTQLDTDLRSIENQMRARLIRSRRFRFVDSSAAVTDRGTPGVQTRQQLSAQMALAGSLTGRVKRDDKDTSHYYKLAMILTDLRTGEAVWKDEYEMIKVVRR